MPKKQAYENRRATQHENWKEIARVGRVAYDKQWARPINRGH